jgi:VWFA-related protein
VRAFLASELLVIAAVVAAQTPSQPTFRSATNLVQVDVVITGADGQPVEDLTADDFQVLDDGIAVPIETFKFLDVAKAQGGDRYPVRNASDEEREAARDDTRLFAILLDDYHVARFGPLRVMQPLIDFVRTLRPSDLLAVYYPLDSSRDVHLTYDREAAIAAIRKFEGRLGDYQPKHPVEEEHLRFPARSSG